MYSGGIAQIGFVAIIIWLGCLSFFLWKQFSFLKKLFPKENGDLKQKLNEVLEVLGEVERRDKILSRNIRQVALEGLKSIQKVSVLRYNPYGDTGGDMSFSIALLDGKKAGLILTSLHTRSGTRIYTKAIIEGKSATALSKEEEEVLKKALEEEKNV